MVVQRQHDRHVGADRRAHHFENVPVRVGAGGRCHGAVQVQQHTVDTGQRCRQSGDDDIGIMLERGIRCRAACAGLGHHDRQHVEAGFLAGIDEPAHDRVGASEPAGNLLPSGLVVLEVGNRGFPGQETD